MKLPDWYRSWMMRRFEAKARRQFALVVLVLQADPKARRIMRKTLGMLEKPR